MSICSSNLSTLNRKTASFVTVCCEVTILLHPSNSFLAFFNLFSKSLRTLEPQSCSPRAQPLITSAIGTSPSIPLDSQTSFTTSQQWSSRSQLASKANCFFPTALLLSDFSVMIITSLWLEWYGSPLCTATHGNHGTPPSICHCRVQSLFDIVLTTMVMVTPHEHVSGEPQG